MSILANLFPKDLYHSYIVEADPSDTVFLIRDFLIERGDIESVNSGVLCQIYDGFNIEDGRMIKEWHSRKNNTEYKNICIIGAKFINHDAEQTLLKILEEPQENTHFFIVVPNSQFLLDTIVSRSHVVKLDSESTLISKKDIETFYKNKAKDRIELVAKMIEKYKDAEGSGGLRYEAINLVNGLESMVYNKFKKDVNNEENKFVLGEIAKARDYLSLPGASVKMILEHIALVL